MTKKELGQYRSKKREIKELTEKLKTSSQDDSRTVSMCKYRIRLLKSDCRLIERYIENIPDSLTRRIFRYYFMDGLSQQEVSRKIYVDKSTVSRKINGYLRMQESS